MTEECEVATSAVPSEQLFYKLLLTEIFSVILRDLEEPDRLNLRLVCHDTEKAVAKSDMYVDGYPGESTICLTQGEHKFELYLGLKKLRKTIKLKKEFGSDELANVVIMRERLFKRIFVKNVDIDYVNFNDVPVPIIQRLLEECMFDEVTIKIKADQYHPELLSLVSKLGRNKTRLIIHGKFVEIEDLLLLEPLKALTLHHKSRSGTSLLLSKLVSQRHDYLNLHFPINSAQLVTDIEKVMEDYTGTQVVSVSVEKGHMSMFMLLKGFRMTEILETKRTYKVFYPTRKASATAANVRLNLDKFTDRETWNGNFELVQDKLRIVVATNCGGLALMYTLIFMRNSDEVVFDEESDEE